MPNTIYIDITWDIDNPTPSQEVDQETVCQNMEDDFANRFPGETISVATFAPSGSSIGPRPYRSKKTP